MLENVAALFEELDETPPGDDAEMIRLQQILDSFTKEVTPSLFGLSWPILPAAMVSRGLRTRIEVNVATKLRHHICFDMDAALAAG